MYQIILAHYKCYPKMIVVVPIIHNYINLFKLYCKPSPNSEEDLYVMSE